MITDEQIIDLLIECDGDTYAVAETLCDTEVSRGDYDGCSSDLEIAFSTYQNRAERLLTQVGGR
jgi:hypothetical protein